MRLVPFPLPPQVCPPGRQRQVRLGAVQGERRPGDGRRGELARVPALRPLPLRAGLLLRLQLDPQLGPARRREQQHQGTKEADFKVYSFYFKAQNLK